MRDGRGATTDGLLLGGCTGDHGALWRPTVWADEKGDGRDLSATLLPGDDGCVTSLTNGEGQWLATGYDGKRAAVWESGDGSTWKAAAPPGAFIGSVGAVAVSAARFDDTWVAVGVDQGPVTGRSPETVAVWRSP